MEDNSLLSNTGIKINQAYNALSIDAENAKQTRHSCYREL
jgi:hypothetical protein